MKKLVGVLLTLALAVSFVMVVPAIASPGMISYWHLDDDSGTTASDSVGTNHGTLTNGPVWVQGQVDGALSFDGIDDYVLVPDSTNLDITCAITVEAWLYPNTVSASSDWRAVVYKLGTGGDHGVKGGYGLLVETNQSEVYFFTEAGGVCFAGAALTLDAWNHVVGTYDDAGNIAIYVNGEYKDGGNFPGYAPYATDRPLYIGGNPDDDGFAPYEFNGIIDEIVIYDRALTADEVLVRYQTTIVTLTAETPQITAISVTPTSIDFGTVKPGDVVSGPDVTVENIGTVKVSVDAGLDPLTGTVFNYLKLNGAYSSGYSGAWSPIVSSLLPSGIKSLTTALDVPSTYSAQGNEAAILVFEATVV